MEAKARKRSQKIQAQLTQHAELKEVLKNVKMTIEASAAKRKRRLPKSQKLWVQHVGQFENGKRSGWGSSMFKSGDKYAGFFNNDKMQGRGTYWFFNVTNSVHYVGEFIDNNFQGLGKMLFKDGSTYLGTFINNSMSSKRAVMAFANGDKFKGEIAQSKRNGFGEYWQVLAPAGESAASQCTLHYEGEFHDDLRHGRGVLFQEGGADNVSAARYEGEYKEDKRHGKVDELSATRQDGQRIVFRGNLDAKEAMSGHGTLDAGNVRYTGEFQVNQFNGNGKLEY